VNAKSTPSLQEKIMSKAGDFTGAMSKIAEYVLSSSTKVAFSSAEEVAEQIGVSSASVVRFAQSLGFNGFQDLKRALQSEIEILISPADKVEHALSNIRDVPDVLQAVVETEISYMKMLLQTISAEQFDAAVRAMAKARTLALFGPGASRSLVDLLNFRLRRFKVNTIVLEEGKKALFESLHWLDSNDTLLVYAFLNPVEEVFIALNYAREVGATTVVITDLATSPALKYADVALVGQRGPTETFHSLVVPSAITNALIIAYAKLTAPQSLNTLRRFHAIREKYGDL
jgi:DNA-binding MurR/RpiR family transcriptional regulator